MRLMSDDTEQPIDKFVRHKQNIQDWYDEMKSYSLTQDEISVLEKHLLSVYGVGDSQEILMLLSMDEKISNFSIKESNELRKIVGKKLLDKIPQIKELFFNKGQEAGNSLNILNYVWDSQVTTQLGYSFSSLHSTGYSLIALQEMNIATRYPDIIWATACLTVSSNANEEEDFTEDDTEKKTKSTKYGKVAYSIGKMKAHGVEVSIPDINKSKFEFSPDLETNQILYGLRGIVGINDDVVHTIIQNRPYTSFEDFYSRIFETNLIQKKHMIQLIKAGSFNSFDEPINIMKEFVKKQIDVKSTLNMQNFKSIVRLGLLDSNELNIYLQYYNFKDYISKNVIRTVDKPKDRIFGMDEYASNFYHNYFSGDSIIGESNGLVEVSEKKFKKEFDNAMQPFKNLMTSEEFIRQYNVAQFYELWNEIASGTVAKWEMDAVCYYSKEHELDYINKELYGVVDFNQLSTEPNIVGYNNYRGRETPKYQTYTICGTVLDKNKDKHTITVLTPTGVVMCKTYAGAFAHYDKTISIMKNGKKETIEKSWLSRGNLVMLRGFRRGDQFILRTYASKGQPKEHTMMLIKEVLEDGSLLLQSERTKI